MNGSASDAESGRYQVLRFSPEPGQKDGFVIVAGADVTDYSIQGYRTKDRVPGEELSDLSYTVTRYESTLAEVLRYFLEDEFSDELERLDQSKCSPVPAAELYLGLTAEFLLRWGPLSSECVERYSDGRLTALLHDSIQTPRVIWLSFEVTIPAGETVSVAAALPKDASQDLGPSAKATDAYELATTLGSSLTFTSQTAAIRNFDRIELHSQNFGFDLQKGITTVPLDLTEACYWLEVLCLES